MKILITTDRYAPAMNGAVTAVLNLRRELVNRGHEVRVLTLSQTAHSIYRNGVTFLGSVPAGLVYPGARLRTVLAGEQIRELLDRGPNLVHSQCEFGTFFPARRIVEALGIPPVHTCHTVYENYTHYFSPSVKWSCLAEANLPGCLEVST